MRYLKRFNESLIEENVQDILDDNVAENLVFTTIVFYVKGKK